MVESRTKLTREHIDEYLDSLLSAKFEKKAVRKKKNVSKLRNKQVQKKRVFKDALHTAAVDKVNTAEFLLAPVLKQFDFLRGVTYEEPVVKHAEEVRAFAEITEDGGLRLL